MEFFRTILSPLIWVMGQILEAIHGLTGSYGTAIVLLSVIMAVVSYPILRFGLRAEQRYKEKVGAMANRLAQIKSQYKGEKQFNQIEKLYKEHNYHPIQSMFSASGFIIQLPFLLAAMLLFINYPLLSGESFLFINDLSKPDALISIGTATINILPIIMSGIVIVDAYQKTDMQQVDRLKFVVISVVLCFVVYRLPSAVIFYWICNNIWSLSLTLRQKSIQRSQQQTTSA